MSSQVDLVSFSGASLQRPRSPDSRVSRRSSGRPAQAFVFAGSQTLSESQKRSPTLVVRRVEQFSSASHTSSGTQTGDGGLALHGSSSDSLSPVPPPTKKETRSQKTVTIADLQKAASSHSLTVRVDSFADAPPSLPNTIVEDIPTHSRGTSLLSGAREQSLKAEGKGLHERSKSSKVFLPPIVLSTPMGHHTPIVNGQPVSKNSSLPPPQQQSQQPSPQQSSSTEGTLSPEKKASDGKRSSGSKNSQGEGRTATLSQGSLNPNRLSVGKGGLNAAIASGDRTHSPGQGTLTINTKRLSGKSGQEFDSPARRRSLAPSPRLDAKAQHRDELSRIGRPSLSNQPPSTPQGASPDQIRGKHEANFIRKLITSGEKGDCCKNRKIYCCKCWKIQEITVPYCPTVQKIVAVPFRCLYAVIRIPFRCLGSLLACGESLLCCFPALITTWLTNFCRAKPTAVKNTPPIHCCCVDCCAKECYDPCAGKCCDDPHARRLYDDGAGCGAISLHKYAVCSTGCCMATQSGVFGTWQYVAEHCARESCCKKVPGSECCIKTAGSCHDCCIKRFNSYSFPLKKMTDNPQSMRFSECWQESCLGRCIDDCAIGGLSDEYAEYSKRHKMDAAPPPPKRPDTHLSSHTVLTV